MATTDTDALEERIARELFYTESPEERHRDGWLSAYSEDRYLYRDLAAAVLPIVAEEVRAGKAEAWEGGFLRAHVLHAEYDARRDRHTPAIPISNPHRATEHEEEKR